MLKCCTIHVFDCIAILSSFQSVIIRPPVRSNGRNYKKIVMFSFFFAAKSPSSLGRLPRNFAT